MDEMTPVHMKEMYCAAHYVMATPKHGLKITLNMFIEGFKICKGSDDVLQCHWIQHHSEWCIHGLKIRDAMVQYFALWKLSVSELCKCAANAVCFVK